MLRKNCFEFSSHSYENTRAYLLPWDYPLCSRRQRKLRVEVYCEVPWSLNCPLTFINLNNSNNFLDPGKIEYDQIFLF